MSSLMMDNGQARCMHVAYQAVHSANVQHGRFVKPPSSPRFAPHGFTKWTDEHFVWKTYMIAFTFAT
jgi:hypothetical protein